MSLINCPECNHEVSDLAEKCPKCAFPLIQLKNTENKNKLNSSHKCNFLICQI